MSKDDLLKIPAKLNFLPETMFNVNDPSTLLLSGIVYIDKKKKKIHICNINTLSHFAQNLKYANA